VAIMLVASTLLATHADGDLSAISSKTAVPFTGMRAVGALLLTQSDGQLEHFCTASVVASPGGDLLITAAHCLQNVDLRRVTFAPGYHDGRAPLGRWIIRAAYVDSAWAQHGSPNDDVAFLVAGQPGQRIEARTGAETLLTSAQVPNTVVAIGYPDTGGLPVACIAMARPYRLGRDRQLAFHCGGYTDGTSGGPLLTRVSAETGLGDVIGVIGGYQQGGATASISYSARFLGNVAALYRHAIRASAPRTPARRR
jgi:V8-like Glu-specific endopeptidase